MFHNSHTICTMGWMEDYIQCSLRSLRIFFRPVVNPETAAMWWLDPGFGHGRHNGRHNDSADFLNYSSVTGQSVDLARVWEAVGIGPAFIVVGMFGRFLIRVPWLQFCSTDAFRIKCGLLPVSWLVGASSTFRVNSFRPLRWTVDMYWKMIAEL